MAELAILDVGHGSSAVLTDGEACVVIDGGCGQTLLQFLRSRGVYELDAVLISHADSDHIGGIIEILLAEDIAARKVYLNPDALHTTSSFHSLRVALADARSRNGFDISPQLTTSCADIFASQQVRVEILAPDVIAALGGVGGTDITGDELTANSLSAVIRIWSGDDPEVFLAGDMNDATLQSIVRREGNLRSRVLVFPHHGGLPADRDAAAFASELCQMVMPDLVVFSIGRGHYDNPDPDIIAAVLDTLPNSHIACTQLSVSCTATLPLESPVHVEGGISRGLVGNKCCAGTILIALGRGELACVPSVETHDAFVRSVVANGLCRGRQPQA